MKEQNISSESWREYDFNGRIYRINSPVSLWVGTTTHRVLDSTGVVHCVPNIGHNGCVVRWQVMPGFPPVSF